MGTRGTMQGVEIISVKGHDYIRVSFSYNGRRHREYLPIPVTKTNLKYAANLVADIKRKIALGTFDYKEAFPESRRASDPATKVQTFKNLGDTWLETKSKLAKNTLKKYRTTLERVWYPKIGNKRIEDIKPSELRKIIAGLEIGNKSINDVLIPLRGIFELAEDDELITKNPTRKITNLEFVKAQPDPFDLQEVEAILAYLKGLDEQAWNYYEFAFFTGLRPGEQIALRWPDIDFKKGYARVERALEAGEVKETKTKGIRDIELLSRAQEALKRQKAHTFLKPEQVVFVNTATGRPLADERHYRETFWKRALRALGIRERDAYQTRHTFATLAIMAGANPVWVARQLGHATTAMVFQTYAKWIDRADRSREKNKIEAMLREEVSGDGKIAGLS